MSSIALSGTISVLSKALKNFANENKEALVRPSEVKIIIALSDVTVYEPNRQYPIKRIEGEPFYRIIKQNKPYMRARKIKVDPGTEMVMTDEVSFLQILDKLFDAFQVESMSKPYLVDAFNRLTESINKETFTNPGFIDFLNENIANAPDKEAAKAEIIAEHTLLPTDLEVWIITPERQMIAGNPVDEPIMPIPFLYAKGELIRQIDFAKDIFQMVD